MVASIAALRRGPPKLITPHTVELAAKARALRCSGYATPTHDIATLRTNPPPMPCRARAATSTHRLGDAAHSRLAATKPTMVKRHVRRTPTASITAPATSAATVWESAKAVMMSDT